MRAIGPSFFRSPLRGDMSFLEAEKRERRNPKKKFTFEIYPLPQRRERHSIRHDSFSASHGFREGRASGGNRGRRLDGKHIYE